MPPSLPDPPSREFTVTEFARREQVTRRTVYRWIAKGAVTVRRTPGGGIRIVEQRTAHTVGAFVPHRRRSDS